MGLSANQILKSAGAVKSKSQLVGCWLSPFELKEFKEFCQVKKIKNQSKLIKLVLMDFIKAHR